MPTEEALLSEAAQTAVTVERLGEGETAEEEEEVGTTGLPQTQRRAEIICAEVIPSRITRLCIPPTGSTTWTFTINCKLPRTVPILHYTVNLYTTKYDLINEPNYPRNLYFMTSNELSTDSQSYCTIVGLNILFLDVTSLSKIGPVRKQAATYKINK